MTRLDFNEYEAYAEAVREASVTMRMQSLEAPSWKLEHATVGSLRVQHGFEGGGSIAEGATVADGWSFYQQSHPGLANGQVMTANDVFAVPPGGDFCLVCQPSHDWVSVVIPTSLLLPASPESEFAPLARPHRLKPPPLVTRRFTALVRRFLASAESHPELLESQIALDSFQDELLDSAKQLITRCEPSECRHFERWHHQTKSTIELALSHPDQSLSVFDLARRSGVPERTLRTAFQRCYALSPVEYFRRLRMQQARRLLLASDQDETTVTQVAFGLGFWDLGRFAGAYRRMFGELPSETLRKRLRVTIGVRR